MLLKGQKFHFCKGPYYIPILTTIQSHLIEHKIMMEATSLSSTKNM